MNTLFFDTETTGLVNHKLDHRHPAQPMAVQIGMKLDGPNRVERAACNYMIAVDGWTISNEAAAITGIDDPLTLEFGVQLVNGVEMFLDLIACADVVVAHNAIFDITVMRRMVQVWAETTGEDYFDPFAGKTPICTMLAATPIMKLPPRRNGDYKWPKLEQAVKFYFNEELEGAHDALVDVRACARVYYQMLDDGVFAAAA